MPQTYGPRRPWGNCQDRPPREDNSTAAGFSSTFAATRARCRGLPSPLSLSINIFLLFSLLLLSKSARAQRDPVVDFCRRFGHQTAVIDRKLYVDGGFINYAPLPDNPTNYTNTFLSYHDLDHLGSDSMPQLYSNLSKNATIPSVNGGILWADDVNKRFYLFGGEYYQTPPVDLSLYSYDVLNNYWTMPADTPQTITGVSYGAGVSISELGDAFYYGGWLSNASIPGWAGPRIATTGLIHYDMDENRWENITGPDNVGRAEGAMVYIPASDGGMLIYLGGSQDRRNGSITGQPMDEIFVFDLASSRWYKQAASGDIPGMRARFCAGVTWAEDRSSYNIYLYGGLGMPSYTSGYDDVYILSMPSFTWIKMFPNTTIEQYPHNTLSCNVIDGAQMMIIGGSFPLDDQTCDAPGQFGAHGLDMGQQNANSDTWFVYRPNITNYIVPSVISSVIGGNAHGAATKTTPDGGFDEPDLKILMSRKYTAPVRTPTREVSPPPPPSSPLSHGAIAGIAVGGAVVLIATLAGIWFCLRRRKRRRETQQTPPHMSSVAPMHGNVPSRGESVWSPGSSHHTPVSPVAPYATAGHSPAYSYQPPYPAPAAIIPNHPVEMPGNVHDSGASEVYDNSVPQSAISRGVSPGDGGLISPYSPGVDPTKYGNEDWPSPIREVEQVRPIQGEGGNVYAAGGYGPQELGTYASGDRGSADSRRHETFYHA